MQHGNVVPEEQDRMPSWKTRLSYKESWRWCSSLQQYEQAKTTGERRFQSSNSMAEEELRDLYQYIFGFYFDSAVEPWLSEFHLPPEIGGNWSYQISLSVYVPSDAEISGDPSLELPVLLYLPRTPEKIPTFEENDRLELFSRLQHHMTWCENSKFGASAVGVKIRFYSFRPPPRDGAISSPSTIDYVDQYLYPIILESKGSCRTEFDVADDMENIERVVRHIRETAQNEALDMSPLP